MRTNISCYRSVNLVWKPLIDNGTHKKLILKKIIKYKLEHDMAVVLTTRTYDKEWLELLPQFSDNKMPQFWFGQLWFCCKWTNWSQCSWERWTTIQNTKIFETFCKKHDWDMNNEISATVAAHEPQKFKQIIDNIRRFGYPKLRKALKSIVRDEMNRW